MRFIDIHSRLDPMTIHAIGSTDCCIICGEEGMARRSTLDLTTIECEECGHTVTFTNR